MFSKSSIKVSASSSLKGCQSDKKHTFWLISHHIRAIAHLKTTQNMQGNVKKMQIMLLFMQFRHLTGCGGADTHNLLTSASST